jgi:hypothetical protein
MHQGLDLLVAGTALELELGLPTVSVWDLTAEIELQLELDLPAEIELELVWKLLELSIALASDQRL